MEAFIETHLVEVFCENGHFWQFIVSFESDDPHNIGMMARNTRCPFCGAGSSSFKDMGPPGKDWEEYEKKKKSWWMEG